MISLSYLYSHFHFIIQKLWRAFLSSRAAVWKTWTPPLVEASEVLSIWRVEDSEEMLISTPVVVQRRLLKLWRTTEWGVSLYPKLIQQQRNASRYTQNTPKTYPTTYKHMCLDAFRYVFGVSGFVLMYLSVFWCVCVYLDVFWCTWVYQCVLVGCFSVSRCVWKFWVYCVCVLMCFDTFGCV